MSITLHRSCCCNVLFSPNFDTYLFSINFLDANGTYQLILEKREMEESEMIIGSSCGHVTKQTVTKRKINRCLNVLKPVKQANSVKEAFFLYERTQCI